ncbi:MAG: MoxR-like ATPase [Myxococcaceae bacterium]|nr:MoxR-like ATPase [Myxococcaceae bacterium]
MAKNGQALQAELQGIPTRNEQTRGAFERPTERSLELLQSLNASGGMPRYSQDSSRVAADVLAQHPMLESAVVDNPDFGDDVIHLLPAELQGRALNDKEFRRKASRSVLTNVKDSHSYRQKRIEWASRNNIYLAEFNDRTIMALANKESGIRSARVIALTNAAHEKCADRTACTAQEAKRIANDEISSRIRQATWQATSEHEIGHTFGLRHNFQGSFDAINYHDGYWDLRKESLTVVSGTENKIPRTPVDLKATADGTIGQLLGGMYDTEYSSIMDYSGKINGDWSGVGKYDEAAILFAYSGDTAPGYVEVFKSARREKRDFAGSDGALMTITGAGLDLPMVNAQHRNPAVPNYTERFHYSVAPLHFGDGANGAPIKEVIESGIKKFREREIRKYSEVKAANDALALKLEANPEMINDPDANAAAIGAAPILEVPYMFCSDDHVGGILSCNRFDRGPDYYEMARTELEDYYNYYFSSHFKRDRYHFSSSGAFNGTYGAFWNVADIYKKWVFEFFKKSGQPGQEIRGNYPLDPMLQDYWTMAVLDGINQHLNVMAVPPTGMFMYRNLARGPQWDFVTEGDEYDALNEEGKAKIQTYYRSRYNASGFADLPRGLGRRMYSSYDFKSGFGFFNRLQEAGHYNDQTGAMFAAVFPDATFLGADDQADFRRYNIPYYLVFKKELTDTFSALWGYQEELVRPIMYLKKNGLTPAGAPKVGTPPVNGACYSGCTIAEKNVTSPMCICPGLEWKRFVSGKDLISGFDYPRETGKICAAGQTTNCLTADQKPAQANIQLTWTSRIYSIYLGEALFRVNYDLDYAKANQVFKLGGAEQQTVATGFHTVEVQDITTGSRYSALEKNGAAPNSTPAIRLIGIGQEQLEMVKDPTKCPLPPYLEYVGYGCMGADEANNPALVEERRKYWTDIFRDTIRDLDLMRGMYQAYGKAF